MVHCCAPTKTRTLSLLHAVRVIRRGRPAFVALLLADLAVAIVIVK